MRHIELAIHQSLGPLVGVILGRHVLAVDRHQASPDHGVPVVALNLGLAQMVLKGLRLIGLHIQNKAIRRVGRRGVAPTGHQVGAQQHQQHQGQQPHRQSTDLHHGKHRSGRNLARGQTQPLRRARFIHRPTQTAHRQPGQRGKKGHRPSKAQHHPQAQHQVTADRHQQQRKTQQARTHDPQGSGLWFAHIAADHPQRWHPGQLQNRRQTKGHQQRQAGAHPVSQRPPTGRGQVGLNQTTEQADKHLVQAVAQCRADQARANAQQTKFDGIHRSDLALALAEHALNGTVVQMARRKTARSQGHGHRTEQGGQQGHQVEKLFCALQGLAHFGAPRLHRLQAHAAHLCQAHLVLGPLHIGCHLFVWPGHRKAPSNAAGRLHQTGGVQVSDVDQQARGKVHEACAPIGLGGEHL